MSGCCGNMHSTLCADCPRRTLAPELASRIEDVHMARLRRYVRAQNKWFRHCATGELTKNGRVPSMPGKVAKHKAYSDAASILRLRNDSSERPHDFPGLCALAGVDCDLRR